MPKSGSAGGHAPRVPLREERAHEPGEALGLGVVQIARQAEGVAAEVDELLQRTGALLRVADDGDASSRPNARAARPEMRRAQFAVRARQLLHPLEIGRASSGARV